MNSHDLYDDNCNDSASPSFKEYDNNMIMPGGANPLFKQF